VTAKCESVEVPVALIVSGEPPSPALVADIDCAPTVAPSVHVVCTRPVALLTPLAGRTLPPPVTTPKFTVVPATLLPLRSCTCTTIGSGSAALTFPDWPAPATTAMFAAAPTATSNVVLVADASPVALAVNV
jgi:hypothetical protein